MDLMSLTSTSSTFCMLGCRVKGFKVRSSGLPELIPGVEYPSFVECVDHDPFFMKVFKTEPNPEP